VIIYALCSGGTAHHIEEWYGLVKILHLTAVIRKENPMYVSWCPELNIASQGQTIDEAISNLKEALELYITDPDAFIPPELYKQPIQCPVFTCLDVKSQ
jgi:predicted RNase H-like HicB family nuclease